MFTRPKRFARRRCPHVHLQGIYGDAINAVGGWRLQCTDCWAYLDGPVALSWVDRDPEGLIEHNEDWQPGKGIWS